MTIALFVLAFFAGGLLVYGISNAPIAEEHPAATSICTPSRARLLTGANLSREQLIAIQLDREELQRREVEIKRLQTIIRQRNRLIIRLRSQLEQTVEQPVTAGGERFEWLEIRGQS